MTLTDHKTPLSIVKYGKLAFLSDIGGICWKTGKKKGESIFK